MNCTPAIPTLSDAVAERVTEPEMTEPPVGAVMETVGGVVSGTTAVANVAVTLVSALTVRVQFPVPVHAPDQPVKVEPEVGAAESVIEVPDVIPDWVQVEPQEIDPPVTVPKPVPDLFTERTKVVGVRKSSTDQPSAPVA